jgi:hypothetical protein
MNTSHRLCIISPSRDGLISLVARLSGGMIGMMVSLSNRISSLPPIVGTGTDPRFNAQEDTKKTPTTSPFDNTCKVDEVSPEVEVGVVAGLRCLQP